MNIRMFGKIAAFAAEIPLVFGLMASPVAAQGFPTKPLTILVAFSAGGPADTLARVTGQEVSKILGQPVLIENRTGANGKIAMQALLRAPKDGYTLAYISPSIMSINPLIDKNLGYDSLRDVQPLTTGLRGSNVLAVNPSLHVKTLQELVAYAKAHPGRLNYGSIGTGSSFHLSTEKLLVGLGIEATHVPYKGESPAITDLVAGNLQLMIVSAAAKPFLENGNLVGLAATGSKRAAFYPQALPIRESGIKSVADFDETPWIGFGLAAGVPAEIVTKLHGAFVQALQSDEVKKRLSIFGEVRASSSQELEETIKRELLTNRQLIESGRIKLD